MGEISTRFLTFLSINLLNTSIAIIEIRQMICCANQLTGFYKRATLAFNGLKKIESFLFINPLMPGGNKKVTHT